MGVVWCGVAHQDSNALRPAMLSPCPPSSALSLLTHMIPGVGM